jgi:hypothetical protein
LRGFSPALDELVDFAARKQVTQLNTGQKRLLRSLATAWLAVSMILSGSPCWYSAAAVSIRRDKYNASTPDRLNRLPIS